MASSNAASESTGGSGSRWTALPAAVLVVLLASSLLFLASSLVGSTTAVGGSVILLLITAVALGRRAGSPTVGVGEAGSDDARDDRSKDDGAESNVWNTIPPWQYDGRHAESGGLTRGEQERALREIQRQADELEE